MFNDFENFENGIEIFDEVFGMTDIIRDEKKIKPQEEIVPRQTMKNVWKKEVEDRFTLEFTERLKKTSGAKRKILSDSSKVFPLLSEQADEVSKRIDGLIKRYMEDFFQNLGLEELKQRKSTKIDKVLHEKVKKSRPNFTEVQRRSLLEDYRKNSYPTKREKVEIAERLDLNYQQVSDWFSNKRTREANKRVKGNWFD
eukprot:GHVP01001087.1.p1 GENE.GHVP01001087.1~~GHVP01001087.1.p1  ORF type:complete len:198 (+),score=46.58 GHVP01001087.1:2598-3191(+)